MAGVVGRIALVTGAGRGIGRAVAELLSARGAQVMGVSRSDQELATLGLEYTVADLGTPDGCARAVAEAERRLGPIDILVCNHGIGSAHERVIWEQDPKVWSDRSHRTPPRTVLPRMPCYRVGCGQRWPSDPHAPMRKVVASQASRCGRSERACIDRDASSRLRRSPR